MSRYPVWARDGADWPNRNASRFVDADGYRWHAQEMGPKKSANAPVCLLLHGTGAATHSWRGVLPLLAQQYRVIAMDLPGHGFTLPNLERRATLPGMAASIAVLLDALDARPDLIVGHSAGVAIGLQLLLDRGWTAPVVGFTPALMPFPGLAARLFPALARILFTNPFVAIIFARLASGPGETAKFLQRATGSHIDPDGERFYQRLFRTSGHCDGAIRMMANWRLEPLQGRLGAVAAPVLLVHGARDAAIPEKSVLAAAALIPGCQTRRVEHGHLAHEEAPEEAVAIITAFAKAAAQG